MKDDRVGLLIGSSESPHVIDIAKSVGVFLPHDPIANGIVYGTLKDGCNWSSIIKHWRYLRAPLKQIAMIATSYPDHPQLAHLLHDEGRNVSAASDQIVAIEITEGEALHRAERCDPTGRRVIERQSDPERGKSSLLLSGEPLGANPRIVLGRDRHRD
jgi:DNA-binding transcriptional MerR regulator